MTEPLLSEIAAAVQLAEDALVLVAMREHRIEVLAAALRAEGEALTADRATADEAERLYARAADRYLASRPRAEVPAQIFIASQSENAA